MSEPGAPLTITQTPGGLVLSGEIDASTASALSNLLIPLPGESPVVTIEMTNVTFIDSSGLRVLIQAHQNAQHSDRQLSIVNPSVIVSRLFDVSGVSAFLNVSQSQ